MDNILWVCETDRKTLPKDLFFSSQKSVSQNPEGQILSGDPEGP